MNSLLMQVLWPPIFSAAISIRFSDVAVLLVFILLPSCLITLILIGRIICPKKKRSQSKAYRSPIEVTEGWVDLFNQSLLWVSGE